MNFWDQSRFGFDGGGFNWALVLELCTTSLVEELCDDDEPVEELCDEDKLVDEVEDVELVLLRSVGPLILLISLLSLLPKNV